VYSQRGIINPYALIAIALVSSAMLMYEILLTRVCALRLFFHFSFLVISNCLLGIGASGSMIAIFQERFRKRERFWIWLSALLFLISLFFVFAFVRTYAIEAAVSFQNIAGLWRISVFNFVAAIPFFFAGSAIGLILTFNAEQVNRVYFLDLLGAGFGCLICPFFLWKTGAGGCFVLVGLFALLAAIIATPAPYRRIAFVIGGLGCLIGLILLPKIDKKFPIPSKKEIMVTDTVKIDLAQTRPYSRWSAISRVDLYPVEDDRRFIHGRGKNTANLPLPEEKFILQDGSASSFFINFSEHPEGLAILERTLYSAAVQLRDNARVFVIGVGGGNDVWAAKTHNARYIKGVELNRQILDIHRGTLSHFSQHIIEDPRIELVADEGRSALMREHGDYDVIQMSGIDTWTALTSGAYMLAENYLYTVEAVRNMYDRLSSDGIIQITRCSQTMETLRLLSNVHTAFEAQGYERFDDSVVCLVSPPLVTLLAKKKAFSGDELERLEYYSDEAGIPLLYHPRHPVNNNVVDVFIRNKDKANFIRRFSRNISPTTDNCPYFFNYTKWNNLFSSTKFVDEHVSVSQGNPLFIIGQLVLSSAVAFLLIVFPVLVFFRKGIAKIYLSRFLVYFIALGLGFIAIEIALMQKLVLFVGHPLYSITVTLFAMLCFTGLGSLISGRWFSSPTKLAWLVPLGLVVFLGTFILFSPRIVTAFIDYPPAVRFLLTGIILVPISLLLGVPFAYGIRLLNLFNPTIIPWAWAVNGCATVVGSILTVIFSMNFGFNFVLVAAIGIYFIGFAAVHGLR